MKRGRELNIPAIDSLQGSRTGRPTRSFRRAGGGASRSRTEPPLPLVRLPSPSFLPPRLCDASSSVDYRYTDGQISSSSSQESRSQGRRRRWTSAGYQSGSLGKPPCQTPSQDSAATGDESAGQAREEVNKPRNQPRRGGLGSHMFAVLDWIGGAPRGS